MTFSPVDHATAYLAAATLAGFIGDLKDAVVILVVINALRGFLNSEE